MLKSPNLSPQKSPPAKPNSAPPLAFDLFRALGAARELRDEPQTKKAGKLLNVIDEICAGEPLAQIRNLTAAVRAADADGKAAAIAALYDALGALVAPTIESNSQVMPVTAAGA